MFRRLGKKLVVVCTLVLSCGFLNAQTDGTYSGYSPYSAYGVGQLHGTGTAWNRGMGGVGIATRSRRFVNTLNPASVTARDSLSCMSDFGLGGRVSIFREGDKKGANTTFNIDNFVISFPLWRHMAMMVGVSPFSDVGYSISYSNTYYNSGKQSLVSSGKGGIYQVYTGVAATFWNRLSVGAQLNYRFGTIVKGATIANENSTYFTLVPGDSLHVKNFAFKGGLQYEQPLPANNFLTLGTTYTYSGKVRGEGIYYYDQGSYVHDRTVNTLSETGLRMGNEWGVGLSWRKADKWMVEFDYIRNDWTGSGMDAVKGFATEGTAAQFASSVGQSFRLGGEITPNRNDIRYYFRRCTYRMGAYYDISHYTVNGRHVNAAGVTLGMTLPVFRWYNGLTVGLDLGRRGLDASQIKENYFGFNVGFNMFDIWFQKPRYE